MFGMSSKEFWEDDPQLYWAYQTFYLKKQEIEFAKDNQYMWLQGMYIYEAVSIAINNILSKKTLSYPEKPYDLGKKEEKTKEKEIEDVDTKVMNKNNYWSRLL